jgi:hypothetical protein
MALQNAGCDRAKAAFLVEAAHGVAQALEFRTQSP